MARRALHPRREGIVPIRERLRAADPIGIAPQVHVEHQGRRHGLLVECPHLSAAARVGIAGTARVAVVEEDQRDVVDEVGVVLVAKPRVGVCRVDREIAVRAQPPEDVAVSLAVRVIDLDDPVLITEEQGKRLIANRQRIVSFRAAAHRFDFGLSGRQRIAAFCVGPVRFSRSSRDPSATPPSIRRGTARRRRQTTRQTANSFGEMSQRSRRRKCWRSM